MQNKRKEGSKLGKVGLKLESYLANLYQGSFPKEVLKTFSKEQSFLQVPLGEAKFLELLVRIKKPQKVLEIGTFRGFSTVFLAKHLTNSAKVWTIERDQKRYNDIHSLWNKVGVSKKITLIKNHAIPALRDLVNKKIKFDLFFIDASKEETIDFFKICYEKLANKDALIVVDNTLWGGEVAERDPKTNAARYMKKFNEFVFKKYKNKSYILPAWDGLTIVIK